MVKILDSNNISNLITMMSVCIGAYITYRFNNIAEKNKFKKEQSREIYKLIKKNFYCTKKTLRNIIEAKDNEEKCIEYAKQYNLNSQKILKDYREKNPNSTYKIMMGFDDELINLKIPSIISKYKCFYLDELFNICTEEEEFSHISIVQSANPTEYYSLDFFSLKILGTLLPYNEFIKFKRIIKLEDSNKNKFNLNKYFNKKNFNLFKELRQLSYSINEQKSIINKNVSELTNFISNLNWIKEKKTGAYILEDFDSEKISSEYNKRYYDFSMSILELMKLLNEVMNIYYQYFYYI